MSRRTGFIDLKYILSLLIDYIKGIRRLKPMSDFQLIEFRTLLNTHIFRKGEKISQCGRVLKSKYEATRTDYPLTLKDVRIEIVDKANDGEDICGNCVSSLFSDLDIKKML